MYRGSLSDLIEMRRPFRRPEAQRGLVVNVKRVGVMGDTVRDRRRVVPQPRLISW